MRLLRTIVPLALVAPALAAAPLASTVVLGKGERVTFRTAAPIAIVTVQGGVPPRNVPFKFQPEQYQQTIAITGLREGEATLLVEDTTEKIGETVRVIVAPKALEDAYHETAGQFETVQIAPPHVVIGGTLYSAAEMSRCAMAETATVICAARMASVAAVVGQDPIPVRASADVQGTTAVLRIGDVPVVSMQSTDVNSLAGRTATAASVLNKAIAGWTRNADSGMPFPATFNAHQSGGRYQLTIEWNQMQGSRGETFLDVAPAELGASADAIVGWDLAVMTDAFRLYTLVRPPLRATPLQTLYNNALKLAGELTRANVAQALARGFVSLQWSTGADPFATLLQPK
jgi:hypothetical protein